MSEVGAGAFSHAEVVNNDFLNQWGVVDLLETWIKPYEVYGDTLRCVFRGVAAAVLLWSSRNILWMVKNFTWLSLSAGMNFHIEWTYPLRLNPIVSEPPHSFLLAPEQMILSNIDHLWQRHAGHEASDTQWCHSHGVHGGREINSHSSKHHVTALQPITDQGERWAGRLTVWLTASSEWRHISCSLSCC